jgi:hypothetical protein
MKKILKALPIVIAILIFFHFGCTKNDESNVGEVNLQTEELLKVETIYQEGDIKYEGPVDQPKVESSSSQALKDKIKLELDKSFSKQVSYAKNAGNLIGVFKDGSCGSYLELLVNMDCEDSNPNSDDYGWTGSSIVTDTYKNVQLYFCVVDNSYFVQTNVDYAILNLTSNLPSGVSRIVRYFDNEDSSNGNWTHYDGSSYSGWFGDSWFGANTRLSFYYYPHTTYHAFPSLGINFGVLGRFGDADDQGYILSDDEDSGNANWCYKDIWNGTSWTSGYSGNITNIMDVNANTKLYICKGEQ